LLASPQVPPLLERVIVATAPDAVSTAEQSEKPVGKVIVAPDGTVNAGLNVTVTVLPAAREPLVELVKPTVHVAVEPAVCGEPANVTAVGVVSTITVGCVVTFVSVPPEPSRVWVVKVAVPVVAWAVAPALAP
jgi:hypothetical protein